MHHIGPRTATVAFQGIAGAFSDLASRAVFPDAATWPCPTFEDVFDAVREGKADYAMLPSENSANGRVAEIHRLLPEGRLHVVGEHFQPVEHHLLVNPGVLPAAIRTVHSHPQALGQCRRFIRTAGLDAVAASNTAAAAQQLAASGATDAGVIASSLAAELYGLEIAGRSIQDEDSNTTRFLVLGRVPMIPADASEPMLTSLWFELRSVPSALYKALAGFATNGINVVKLESYMVNGLFTQARFYIEVEAHPKDPGFRHALAELEFFSIALHLMGTYPQSPFRLQQPSSMAA